MDEKQLRAIQARCGAATPGPWVASYNYSNVVEFDLYSSVKMFSCGPTLQGSWDAIGPQAIADAAFIAAARQDVPALLAEIDALRRQLAETQAEIAAFVAMRAAANAAIAEAADLRRQLAQAWEEFEVLGIAAGAENPSSPESILTAILHMTPGRPAKGATHDN